jgi:lipopolysaccharide export system ATP-binding protein
MVDLLGMFRRRPAKRGPQGFARSREDITALGDSMGEMLTSPVRDAPPMARDTPDRRNWMRPGGRNPRLAPAGRPAPRPKSPRPARPRPTAQWRGAPRLAPRGLSGCA